MSTIGTTYDDQAIGGKAVERDARELLGQVMGFVAVTVGFAALGADFGRDLSGGIGLPHRPAHLRDQVPLHLLLGQRTTCREKDKP